jgi:hypothetical protein
MRETNCSLLEHSGTSATARGVKDVRMKVLINDFNRMIFSLIPLKIDK